MLEGGSGHDGSKHMQHEFDRNTLIGRVRSDMRSACSNHAAKHARLRSADSLELEHGPGPLQDNKALNRSGEVFVVGLSPDGRRLPLYPAPVSLIYIFRSARLTRTLSCEAIARRHARGVQRIAVSSTKACGHRNGHARRQLRTQWQQAPAARIRSQYFDWASSLRHAVGMLESCGKTCSTSIGRPVRIGRWPRPIAG
ncbi:hypothetical protein MFFC18_18610 [Mariniblastus fucicola]|uniref:Uncharacterized protein n=1 Tax=Mariniblastus fucicola TaxID=980251 RepID=A0A5B9PAN8_9BACT|nr:hypothetical protein MFFC18_18610 [Mariniblastus fucicola]